LLLTAVVIEEGAVDDVGEVAFEGAESGFTGGVGVAGGPLPAPGPSLGAVAELGDGDAV
jgi:hypothetical protein